MTGIQAVLAVLLGIAAIAGPSAASAQNLDLRNQGQDIVIEADNGIEWHQTEKIFIARGNARATRANITVYADVLRAYYREKEGGGSDIWRLDADGHVRIESPGQKAVGDLAVYDVDKGVLVLSGKDGVRLDSGDDVVTAKKQIEYWDKKEMAVARGDAHAHREDKDIYAEVLVAYLGKDPKTGKSEVYRMEAFDNVHIETQRERVDSDRGVYNARSGIATVTGRVKLQRDKNVLNGCKAEVNLNTSVSRLFGCDEGGRGRVSGTLRPEKQGRNLEKQ